VKRRLIRPNRTVEREVFWRCNAEGQPPVTAQIRVETGDRSGLLQITTGKITQRIEVYCQDYRPSWCRYWKLRCKCGRSSKKLYLPPSGTAFVCQTCGWIGSMFNSPGQTGWLGKYDGHQKFGRLRVRAQPI
jgi:hypothetical protein